MSILKVWQNQYLAMQICSPHFLFFLTIVFTWRKGFSNRFYQLFDIAIKLNNCIWITKYIRYIQNILLYLLFILSFYRMKYNINVDIHTLNWTLQVMTKLSNSRLNFLRIIKLQQFKERERDRERIMCIELPSKEPTEN